MANKQIKDFDLKESIDGEEDLLIQDNGITKRIKTSKLMNNLDLSNYYTKAEVDKLLANTDLSIDMADYYDKATIDNLLAKKANASHTHSYNNLTDKPSIPSIDGLATKKEVTDGLATKSDATHNHDKVYAPITHEHKQYLTSHQNISGKADKTYVDAELAKKSDKTHTHSYNNLTDKPTIPSTANLATKTELTNGLATKANKSEIPSLEGYATETFVTNKIAEASLSGGEVDLSEYATKDELATKSNTDHTHSYNDLTGKPTIPTKTSDLNNDSGYLTSHQDISNLALKSEIPDVSSFITSDDLPTVPTKVSELANDKNYISSIPSEYVTETELTAKGYLTSHQDISGLQTKTDNNLTTTSKEVVGAINEVKDMADLILDTEVRLDKTYSSSKIYSAIQDAIDSSKNFTLNEIEKMSGASYKVVTSTAEMTDGKIIYLLENGATYDMYIVEEAGTVTKIGDTAIDLSSYLKITDAESTYLKKTDATITYTAQTSFNNHINDTVAHLTQLEKNKLLTTDNITSTINNNSDNTQIPSAKATYDLANTKANTNHTHNTSDIKGLSIPTKVGELTNDAGYISEVINNLTSTDTDKPLSANQGKVLKTELDKTNAKLGEKADKSYVDDKANETISDPTELDTDKYIKNGFYSIGDATKRTNLPIQKVGTLLVYYAGHYVIQEYILNENLRRFMRRSTDKGTNWSAWQELATMDNVVQCVENKKPNAKTVSFELSSTKWNCGTIYGNTNNGGNFKYDYYVTLEGNVELVKQDNGQKGSITASLSGTTLTLTANGNTDFKTVTIIKS